MTPCCGRAAPRRRPAPQLQAGGDVEAAARGVLVQRQAADELHREERLRPALGHPGLVDLRDAGVLQPARAICASCAKRRSKLGDATARAG